jgi:hypothetical protein
MDIVEKQCSWCKETKKLNKFYNDKHNSTGKSSRCKSCAKQESKKWYQTSEKYRQIIRDSGLKHRFGINSEDYFQMLQDQNNSCAICKEKEIGKYLHVDHDHLTGEVRGLLCKNCNHGLGNFKDKIENLNEAIKYLSR